MALGSLTYHFPSQTQLLRECLLLHVSEEFERLEAVAAQLREMNPSSGAEVASAVEQEFRRSIDSYGPRAELELHLHAGRDPELREVSQRSFASYENFVAAALQALGVPEPERHAPTVVAMLTGFAMRGVGAGTGGAHDAAGIADGLLTIMKGAATRSPLTTSSG